MKAADLKGHNLSLIMHAVMAHPGRLSRADLARYTGLTRPAVTSLVDHLITGKLLSEGEPIPGNLGRPRIPLEPAELSAVALGIEIRAHSIGVLARDLPGKHTWSYYVDFLSRYRPVEATADRIAELVNQALALVPERWGIAGTPPVAGVCLSVPGRVTPDGLSVMSAPNLAWEHADLIKILRANPAMRGLNVSAHNDNQLSVLNEIERRPGESFLYVRARTGVGGAIVIDGNLLHGNNGWSGEIGHTTVINDGAPCKCGRRGCLEAYISPDALKRAAGVAEKIDTTSLIESLNAHGTQLLQEQLVKPLGFALSNALNILDLGTVVLGGYLSMLGDETLSDICDVVARDAFSAELSGVSIEREADTEGAALRGAGRAAVTPLLDSPDEWIASL